MALTTPDLWINVKGDSFVSINGSSEVDGWGDLTTGGTSHDLTAETNAQADFLATDAGINGQPSVFKKAGKNSWLRTASFAVFPDAPEITVYMVIKSISSGSVLDRYIDCGPDSLVVMGNQNTVRVTYKGQLIQIGGNYSSYKLVRFTSSASGCTLTVDTNINVTSSVAQTAGLGSDRLSIFSSSFGFNTGNKSFGEIAIYTALHGSTDITDNEAYFRTTYGLSAAVITPLITFPAIPLKSATDADFDPGATSTNPAAIAYASSDTSVATIVSGQIHIVGLGSTVITASQTASGIYGVPASKTQTLTVATTAVIAFNTLPTKTVGDADFNPGATSNSPAPINYLSSNPAVATITTDGKIHLVAAGTATITAYQGSAIGFTAATNVSRTLTVNALVIVSSAPAPPGGMFFLDGIDLWLTYGMFIETGSADFLRFPPKKESISHDWIDANGVDVDLTAIFFSSREVSLNCAILAADEDTYWLNHDKFITQITRPGKHRLELASHQGRQYYVYYKECNNYSQVEPLKGQSGAHLVGHKFTIVLVEPEPNINHIATAISDDGGRVIIT